MTEDTDHKSQYQPMKLKVPSIQIPLISIASVVLESPSKRAVKEESMPHIIFRGYHHESLNVPRLTL